MEERRRREASVPVEEVYFDVDGPPPDLPPPAPRRRPPWRALAAVAVAAVVGVITVAIWDPGADTATTPSTTTGGPVRFDTIDEHRALLPASTGFELTRIDARQADPIASGVAVLYASAGATVDEGSWLLLVLDRESIHLPLDAGFDGPPQAAFIGRLPAVIGPGVIGDESVVFDLAGIRAAVTSHALAPGTAESIARQVRVVGGVPEIPADAVPAGLVAQPALRVPDGLDFAALPSASSDRWDVAYVEPSGATLTLTVTTVAGEQSEAVGPLAAFFLDDVSAPTVRGVPAIEGERDGVRWLIWTEGSNLVTLAATGVAPERLVAAGDALVLALDPDWSEAGWRSARRVADFRQESDARSSSAADVARIVDRGSMPGATSWWDVTARLDQSTLSWTLRTGDIPVERDTTSIGGGLPLERPFDLEAAGRQVYNLDPPGADAGEMSEWYAVAIVVVDPSLAGSMLRLTTDGPRAATTETTVHEVRGLDGHLFAAAALRWTDHYTAELVGPDGIVLAVASDTA